jgi:hypothetical protein
MYYQCILYIYPPRYCWRTDSPQEMEKVPGAESEVLRLEGDTGSFELLKHPKDW